MPKRLKVLFFSFSHVQMLHSVCCRGCLLFKTFQKPAGPSIVKRFFVILHKLKETSLMAVAVKSSKVEQRLSYWRMRFWPIKCRCCPDIETSQLICCANQLTGFYTSATLALNGLISFEWNILCGSFQLYKLSSYCEIYSWKTYC